MAEPIRDIDPETVRRNLERVRERCGPEVEILAATKYVLVEELGRLAEAGVELVGENRLQDLEAKRELYGDRFAWDFIGNLQSRKIKRIVPLVRLIHSVATDSALEQLGRHGGPETEILVEVNVAGEEGKGGVAPAALGEFIERAAGSGGRADDDAAVHHRSRGIAPAFRAPRRARRRARAGAALDGDQPGLGGRRGRGRDDHPPGNHAVPLSGGSGAPRGPDAP